MTNFNQVTHNQDPIDYIRLEDVPTYFKALRKQKKLSQTAMTVERGLKIHVLQAIEIRVPQNIKLTDVEAYAKALGIQVAIVFNENKTLLKVSSDGQDIQDKNQLESS